MSHMCQACRAKGERVVREGERNAESEYAVGLGSPQGHGLQPLLFLLQMTHIQPVRTACQSEYR